MIRRVAMSTIRHFSWALFVGSLALAPSCAEPAPPNIVLITVDTLRADELGAYGNREAATPVLDKLASGGTVFTRSAAPMPLTRPSHFSMLTSRYPREHGVLNNAMALPETALTVSEILFEEGYQTGAFVGVTLLGRDSGAEQGFSTFDMPGDDRERPAQEVVQNALSWLDGLADKDRIFLWLHLFDPHLPYAPPYQFRPPELAEAPEMSRGNLQQIAAQHDGDVPAETLAEARQLYRGEVAYTDHWIGELLDGLSSRVDIEDTMVVFTADHGECFENGIYFEHADCLYQPAVHIPMIVRYPEMFAPGQRIDTQTSIVDVAPTVLRAAGLEIPTHFSGRPLQDIRINEDRFVLVQYPFFQERAARNRPIQRQRIRSVAGDPTQQILLDDERVGILGRDWKYLREDQKTWLYVISPKIDETTNAADTRPEVRQEMDALLDKALAAHPLEIIAPGEINDELRATLEALGYFQN